MSELTQELWLGIVYSSGSHVLPHSEAALCRIQELYEKQFRQQTVRTETLGNDRYSRNYYWGLGGHQSVIYVEDSSGTWCIIDNMDDLLKLKDSLEVKVRMEWKGHGLGQIKLLATNFKWSI